MFFRYDSKTQKYVPAFLRYNTSTNNYSKSGNVPREVNCNGFTATNIGDTPVKVNGAILFPSLTPATVQGDSKSFGGNEGEIYIGYIQIAFENPSAGTAPLIEIIQKFYIDTCE